MIVAGGLGVLIIGLWYIQIVCGKEYLEEQVTQSSRSVRIPAVRGKILDCEGRSLADNKPQFNLCLYLEELSSLFRTAYTYAVTNESAIVAKLYNRKLTGAERAYIARKARYWVASNCVYRAGKILGQEIQLSEIEFQKHYQERLALPMQILTGLTITQVALINESPSIPPGIDIEAQPVRVYPRGTLAAHIIGYLSRDDRPVEGEDAFFNYLLPDYKGVIGIEGKFEEYLRGRAGYKSILVNSLGYKQSESIWTDAEPGRNVVLTVDADIQELAEKALNMAQENVRGAVVVMNPDNGDILALASAPSFNPGSFIPRISKDEMQRLNDPTLRPLINRASQGRYAPGSVFKIVTALACLEAGLDPNEQYMVQPDPSNPSHGCIFVGNRKIKDTAPPGLYDLRRALVRSSNAYFVNYGLKAGLNRIIDMGNRFFLGQPIGIPTGQSDSGVFPNLTMIRERAQRGDPWTDGDTANLCIGQGIIAVNPVQVAVMVSAVANGGKVYYPRLVKKIEPPQIIGSQDTAIEYPTRLRGEIKVPSAHLELIKKAMLDDVFDPEGTGRGAAIAGFNVAGKTGTAEVQEGNRTVDKITWFASFAPYEKPRYVVVVLVESGVSGGRTCAPVAGNIYRGLLALERKRQTKLAMTYDNLELAKLQ